MTLPGAGRFSRRGSRRGRVGARIGALPALLVLAVAPAAAAQPSFDKAFAPATIGPGSVSTLSFDVVNGAGVPVSDLAFTDTLPAGVTIAAPAGASSGCGGTLSAPAGGGTIVFTDGTLAPFASCSMSVNVTSSTPGTHMNVSGDLTSSAGNSGPASADLTVDTARPGLLKSFAPSSVALGSRSTLTLTIDNTANASAADQLTVIDNLPGGLVIASPANASTTCTGGVVTAEPDTALISYTSSFTLPSIASVPAGASCTVSVDVIATAAGAIGNTTEDMTFVQSFNTVSCGRAGAVLQVTADALSLVKSFSDDPVPSPGTVTLEFTITNFNRSDAATGISFSDDLEATLTGLVAVGLPLSDPCGAGSTLSGTSLLTLSGGNLGPEGTCTFSATLQVPADVVPGAYPNTTGSITGDVGGVPTVGGPASESLFVRPAPALTKSFTDDPVGADGTVTLEFTITNTSPTFGATDVAFEDVFYEGLPTAAVGPPAEPCGAGSNASFTPLINPPGSDATPARLTVSGASLAPGASCSFDLTLDVAVGVPNGVFTNTTTAITGTVDGVVYTGSPASDDLVVVAAPALLKEFTDDPVVPGGTVTLEFTLSHDPDAPGDATAIAFSDDLDAALSGLVATGLPASDVCGVGSQLSGTSTLSFTGGSLSPGASCTFSAALQVPGVAPAGKHTNTTSDVTATVLGVAASESPASDQLSIAGLTLAKSFTDDPAIPGGTVTLEFTITNISPVSDATDIQFQDDLDDVLASLTATGLPLTDPCGTGSSLTGAAGNTRLVFGGGSLMVGQSCSFSVTLQVPPAAAPGSYLNWTTGFSATIDAATVLFDDASDQLTLSNEFLSLAKSFTDDPVAPGGTVTLEFTLTNLDPAQTVTAISFSDDLDAALSGLVAIGLPAVDVCGTGSQLSGTSVINLTDGDLSGGASCTFSVALQVPAGAPLGATATNTTSQVTGTLAGLAVTGDSASDVLLINFLDFAKSFDGDTTAGGTPVLTFTIDNLSSGSAVSDLAFSDDLDAVLSGLVATGLPASGVCGPGSQLAGTSFLTLTGASLPASASCSFDVTLQVPAAAAVGSYLNTTSDLFQAGLPAASPATATLIVTETIPPQVLSVDSVAGTGGGELSECESTGVGIVELSVEFDEAMRNPAGDTEMDDVTNPSNYILAGAGGNGDFDTTGCGPVQGDDLAIAVDGVVYAPGSFTATLALSGGAPLPDDLYRLFVCDELTDVAGNALDGDGNGLPGTDFVRSFRVDGGNAFANGHLDCDVSGWDLAVNAPGEIAFDPLDAIGSTASGSALVTNLTGSTSFRITQCLPVSSSDYQLSGAARVDTAFVSANLLCRFYSQQGCAGTQLGARSAGSVSAEKGSSLMVFESMSGGLSALLGSASTRCGVELVSTPAAFDAYVDDLVLIGGPQIFADSFESGDTSAWSNTVQ